MSRNPLLAFAVGVGLALGALAVPQPASAAPTVTLSGVAYSFLTGDPIPLARIAIDETGAATTANWSGRWSIQVPAGRDVTPYVRALGFRTMYAQTFRAVDADIPGIYLQTPDVVTAAALEALVTGYQGGRSPFDGGCVVVSTVSDPRVVGMPFDQFADFAPHGVPGARASSVPALRAPFYFNDMVLPVPNRVDTSTDGGVMWTNVPPGGYEFSASHPTVRFATFAATCKDNRFINASPPQGLHGIPA